VEGGQQNAAKKVVCISTTSQELPDTITHTSPHQQYSQEQLKNIKVIELLALLFEKGRIFNKKNKETRFN